MVRKPVVVRDCWAHTIHTSRLFYLPVAILPLLVAIRRYYELVPGLYFRVTRYDNSEQILIISWPSTRVTGGSLCVPHNSPIRARPLRSCNYDLTQHVYGDATPKATHAPFLSDRYLENTTEQYQKNDPDPPNDGNLPTPHRLIALEEPIFASHDHQPRPVLMLPLLLASTVEPHQQDGFVITAAFSTSHILVARRHPR